MIKRFLVLLFCFILVSTCAAKSINLQKYADNFLKDSSSPGVQISLMKRGETKPITVTAGLACIENRVKMSPDSVIKIGSISKVFTGILIHELIDKNKLSLDSKLSTFLPSYKFPKCIKIINLLTHTSGLKDMFDFKYFLSNLCRKWTPQEILKFIASKPLNLPSGTKAKYCNTGFTALAFLYEKITGQSYFDGVYNNIAKPLKIKTIFEANDTSIIPNMSCGYTNRTGKLQKPILFSASAAFGTGDLMTTSKDLVKIVNVDNLLKTPLLNKKNLEPFRLKNGEKAEKKFKLKSGLIFYKEFEDTFFIFYFPKNNVKLIGKLGSFPGFSSVFLYDPVSQYAVVVLSNLEDSLWFEFTTAYKILLDMR